MGKTFVLLEYTVGDGPGQEAGAYIVGDDEEDICRALEVPASHRPYDYRETGEVLFVEVVNRMKASEFYAKYGHLPRRR